MPSLAYVLEGSGISKRVEIQEDATVGMLMRLIKMDNPLSITCDVKDLELYVENAYVDDTNGKKLKATRKLFHYFPGGVFPSSVQCGVAYDLRVRHASPRLGHLSSYPCNVFASRLLIVGKICENIFTHMTVNPPELIEFARGCHQFKAKIQGGGMIELPFSSYLLGNQGMGSRIFVRECYLKLLERCHDVFHTGTASKILVHGSPGIGKTYFGVFLVFDLIRAGKTVVYESRATKQRYLFTKGVVVEGPQDAFPYILISAQTYYIVDGLEPENVVAKTVLVNPPDQSLHSLYWSFNTKWFYMPVWTEREIMDCREFIFPHIPEKIVQDRFRKWGGIARDVLTHAESHGHQQYLETALAFFEENVIFGSLREERNKCGKSICHEFLHYCVNEAFQLTDLEFASRYVATKIFSVLFQRCRGELLHFIAGSHVNPVKQRLLEIYVHSIQPQRGHFRDRRLPIGNLTTKNLKIQDGSVKVHGSNIRYDSDSDLEDFNLLSLDDNVMRNASDIEDDHDGDISDNAVTEVHSFDPSERKTCNLDLSNVPSR